MPASNENTDVDSVPATPGRSATLPSPVAGQNTAQLSSSPNTSKSRFANNVTGGAQDSLGSLGAGLGTKSMPGSRRTSAIPGNAGSDDSGSFGLDKLSLGDNKGKEDGTVSRWRCMMRAWADLVSGQGELCAKAMRHALMLCYRRGFFRISSLTLFPLPLPLLISLPRTVLCRLSDSPNTPNVPLTTAQRPRNGLNSARPRLP